MNRNNGGDVSIGFLSILFIFVALVLTFIQARSEARVINRACHENYTAWDVLLAGETIKSVGCGNKQRISVDYNSVSGSTEASTS